MPRKLVFFVHLVYEITPIAGYKKFAYILFYMWIPQVGIQPYKLHNIYEILAIVFCRNNAVMLDHTAFIGYLHRSNCFVQLDPSDAKIPSLYTCNIDNTQVFDWRTIFILKCTDTNEQEFSKMQAIYNYH